MPRNTALLDHPSFETPKGTFETFQAAFRAGRHVLEYRCLAEPLKEKHSLTFDRYPLVRARLLREEPGLRWLSKATLDGVERIDPDLAEGIAFVLGRRLRVRFVREWFWEVRLADGTRVDDFLEGPVGDLLEPQEPGWTLRLPFEALARLDPRAVERVTAGADWKLLEILPEPEP
jgi:hypothetical protein